MQLVDNVQNSRKFVFLIRVSRYMQIQLDVCIRNILLGIKNVRSGERYPEYASIPLFIKAKK